MGALSYGIPMEVGTKSPAHAKNRVQLSDIAPHRGLPGVCIEVLCNEF